MGRKLIGGKWLIIFDNVRDAFWVEAHLTVAIAVFRIASSLQDVLGPNLKR